MRKSSTLTALALVVLLPSDGRPGGQPPLSSPPPAPPPKFPDVAPPVPAQARHLDTLLEDGRNQAAQAVQLAEGLQPNGERVRSALLSAYPQGFADPAVSSALARALDRQREAQLQFLAAAHMMAKARFQAEAEVRAATQKEPAKPPVKDWLATPAPANPAPASSDTGQAEALKLILDRLERMEQRLDRLEKAPKK
jgi:hypothetical protein